MKLNWQIAKLTLVNEDSLTVLFTHYWYQEDIKALLVVFFSILATKGEVQTIEHVIGADREYCRFLWQGLEYGLNFDCYSQSCWFEFAPYISEGDFTELSQTLAELVS